MRIALDHQIFTLQTYGGISRYFYQLAKGMIELEQEVKIFSPYYSNAYIDSLPQATVNGKRVHYHQKCSRLFMAYNHLACRYQIKNWKPNLVHETYYSRYSSLSRKLKTPVVITIYDMIHELFAVELPRGANTIVNKKKAIDRSDHIICISQNTKNDLIHLYNIEPSKISVVLLGFEGMIEYKNHANELTSLSRPFLLYVGLRGGYKNFSGFLRAIASSTRLISDFDIISFGGGSFSHEELLLIDTLGFSKNQVRQVSGDDVMLTSYYKTARAFIYPSLYEGFGIPPLEAMSNFCPVVSSNTSSMPEVIGSAAEYFNPYDTDYMRCAIETVVYSDNRIIELQLLGKERLKNFSWGQCSRETLNIYQALV